MPIHNPPEGAGYTQPVEQYEFLPMPEEGISDNQSNFTPGALQFAGASYLIWRKLIMNRLIFRSTGGAPYNISWAIYQVPGGGLGVVANKIASIAAFAVAANNVNYEAAFAEGNVTIEEGIAFIVFSCTGAVRSYATRPHDLLNQNVQPNTHPCKFIGVATPAPATINPITLTPTTNDSAAIVRFRRV